MTEYEWLNDDITWIGTSKCERTYDALGNVTHIKDYDWDLDTNAWILCSTIECYYRK